MNNNDLIKLGHTLGTVVMFGIVVLKRKSNLRRENHLLRAALESANKRTLYMATILDNNDIEIDEFDRIAMHEL